MDTANLKLEKFTGYGSKVSRKIGINRAYGFSFPKAFVMENKLEKGAHTQLFFDKDARVIGIHFEHGGDNNHTFKLVVNKRDGDVVGAQSAAKSFFTTYDLVIDDIAGSYDYEKKEVPEIGELFLIQLKDHATPEQPAQ